MSSFSLVPISAILAIAVLVQYYRHPDLNHFHKWVLVIGIAILGGLMLYSQALWPGVSWAAGHLGVAFLCLVTPLILID